MQRKKSSDTERVIGFILCLIAGFILGLVLGFVVGIVTGKFRTSAVDPCAFSRERKRHSFCPV